MQEIEIKLANEAATKALGQALAPVLRAGDVVRLVGDLGAGKTTLARALLRTRCSVEDVPSPTYTLVETYQAPDLAIWHFDLYRLERPDDVWELGLEEALDDGASLIEWPDRAGSHVPANALQLTLTIDGTRRHATFKGDDIWCARLRENGIG